MGTKMTLDGTFDVAGSRLPVAVLLCGMASVPTPNAEDNKFRIISDILKKAIRGIPSSRGSPPLDGCSLRCRGVASNRPTSNRKKKGSAVISCCRYWYAWIPYLGKWSYDQASA